MSRQTKNTQDDYFEYLDDLRESGVTNMFGARPYLMRAFPELVADRGKEAGKVLSEWMRTFESRHPAASPSRAGAADNG